MNMCQYFNGGFCIKYPFPTAALLLGGDVMETARNGWGTAHYVCGHKMPLMNGTPHSVRSKPI